MGRADTFREAMTAARSLHNRIRNHAIVSTFLLTVQLGCFAYMRSRHSRVARLREFFFFFSNDAHRPNPFRPVERARGNRGVSEALESFQYSCSKLKTISIPRDSGSMLCLSPVERSRPNGSASPSTQRFFMVNREYILIAMRAQKNSINLINKFTSE